MIIDLDMQSHSITNSVYSEIRGCLLSHPGRGDCAHYIGQPDETGDIADAYDEYGRPYGWCEVCWRGEEIRRLKLAVFYGLKKHGHDFLIESVLNDKMRGIENGKIDI